MQVYVYVPIGTVQQLIKKSYYGLMDHLAKSSEFHDNSGNFLFSSIPTLSISINEQYIMCYSMGLYISSFLQIVQSQRPDTCVLFKIHYIPHNLQAHWTFIHQILQNLPE